MENCNASINADERIKDIHIGISGRSQDSTSIGTVDEHKDLQFNLGSKRKTLFVGLSKDGTNDMSLQIDGGRGYQQSGGSEYAKAIVDTTINWGRVPEYVPERGMIIVYSDKSVITKDEKTYYVPGIKIGDGETHLADLVFTTDDIPPVATAFETQQIIASYSLK